MVEKRQKLKLNFTKI